MGRSVKNYHVSGIQRFLRRAAHANHSERLGGAAGGRWATANGIQKRLDFKA
jgi:hypothetical protein